MPAVESVAISCIARMWTHLCPRDGTRSSSPQLGSPQCQVHGTKYRTQTLNQRLCLPLPDTPGQAPGTGARGRQLETGPLSHQYSYHREETAGASVVTVAILRGPLGQDSTSSQGLR